MKKIYNITDTSDGETLLSITTDRECKTTLAKVKKETDKLWYASQDETELLTPFQIGIVMATQNGDWNEIFEELLTVNNVVYEVATLEEV